MAFRIHDSVVRGEIDNRVKGIVRGQIWVEGRTEPVLLELQGNAHPDLAGCLLTFVNSQARVRHLDLEKLHPLQRGSIGDLTASRKVRVSDEPRSRPRPRKRRQKRRPEPMANALYLEWFSDANGRVVIESTDYEVTISAPEWRMTPEEEAERDRQSSASMAQFTAQLTDAIERHKRGQKDPEEPWDEHDYEKFLKESDARTDKYMELLDKYGHSDKAEAKIAEEMGRTRQLTEEEAAEESRRIEEINAACEQALHKPEPEPDPQREGIDWIRTEDGDLRHPLQHRCFESALKFWRQTDALGLEKYGDKDLGQFVFEFQTTGVKLAGALNGVARGEDFRDTGFTVACLKRALDHLHQAQAGLEAVAPKKLLPETLVAEARRELLGIRQGILELMDQFRSRK
jgi:hypothetical protein